jgi:hypothetical protein
MRYEPINARWRVVSAAQFNSFLSAYPRKWQVDPPLHQQAVFRNFRDSTLGEFPADVIATWNMSQWFGLFTVRLDVALNENASAP